MRDRIFLVEEPGCGHSLACGDGRWRVDSDYWVLHPLDYHLGFDEACYLDFPHHLSHQNHLGHHQGYLLLLVWLALVSWWVPPDAHFE